MYHLRKLKFWRQKAQNWWVLRSLQTLSLSRYNASGFSSSIKAKAPFKVLLARDKVAISRRFRIECAILLSKMVREGRVTMKAEIRVSKKVKGWLFDLQNRLLVLLTCFFALLVLFLVLLWNSTEGQRWLAQWQSHRHALQVQVQLAQALRHDPSIGTPLTHFIVKAGKDSVVPSALFCYLSSWAVVKAAGKRS